MKIIKIFLLVALASTAQAQTPAWTLVYQNDADGNVLKGDIQLLINAVRKGLPIRVAWGYQRPSDPGISVEHVADAAFLTIMSQKLVQAQIEPIYGQRPMFDEEYMAFRDNFWITIANTNGKSVTAIRNFTTGELEDQSIRQSKFTWYVQADIESLRGETDSLF